MEQKEVIRVIERNSKLSYEEMKAEAKNAGLTSEEFEVAWSIVASLKKRTYPLFFALGLVTFGFVFSLLTPLFSSGFTIGPLLMATLASIPIGLIGFALVASHVSRYKHGQGVLLGYLIWGLLIPFAFVAAQLVAAGI